MATNVNTEVSGIAGTATLISAEPGNADQTASLEAWLLALPGQHPLWDYYMISVIHLRPIEGVKPPHKNAPHMAHEIIVTALDPELNASATDRETLRALVPVNYEQQFAELTDQQAIEVVRLLVKGFVNGALFAEPSGIDGARQIWWAYVWDAIEKVQRV